MKKLVAIALTAAMFAASATTVFAGDLNFTTGGDQGTYYGFGSVLAGQVSSNSGYGW